jgi:hypothetical protein
MNRSDQAKTHAAMQACSHATATPAGVHGK